MQIFGNCLKPKLLYWKQTFMCLPGFKKRSIVKNRFAVIDETVWSNYRVLQHYRANLCSLWISDSVVSVDIKESIRAKYSLQIFDYMNFKMV